MTTLVAAICCAGLTTCSEPAVKAPIIKCIEDGKWRDLIETFIAKAKGWPPSDYCIQLVGLEKDKLVFHVLHNDDLKTIQVGGGKSVELYVDAEKMKVTKILLFQ